MSNYTLGIVAHPRRASQARALECTVSADMVVYDLECLGPGGNHLETISALYRNAVAGGSEWIVVLEDDAVPVGNFHQQLSMALDVAPSPVVSLYNGTGYPAQHQHRFAEAAKSDACWILHDHLRHAVGYALRRDVFDLMFHRTIQEHVGRGWPMDDAISAWCRRWQHPVAYTSPSLVDHADDESVILVRKHRSAAVGQRNRPRRAHRVGQRAMWTGSSVVV